MTEEFPFFDGAEFTDRIACPYQLLSNIPCILNADHEGPHRPSFEWQLWAHSPIVNAAGECLRCHLPADHGVHQGYAVRRARA